MSFHQKGQGNQRMDQTSQSQRILEADTSLSLLLCYMIEIPSPWSIFQFCTNWLKILRKAGII